MVHRKKKLLLWMMVFGLSFGGCEKKRALIKINLQARTHQGEMISQAAVLIDGKNVGETDTRGGFATEISAEFGSRPKVEVRKESDIYYFAPYIDSVPVQEDQVQVANIKATLYFVPKPKPMGGGNSDEKEASLKESVASDQSSSSDEAPPPPVLAATEHDNEVDQTPEASLNQEGAANPAQITQEEVPLASQQPTPVAPLQKVPEQLPGTTKVAQSATEPLPGTDAKSHQVDELAAKVAEKATQESMGDRVAGRLVNDSVGANLPVQDPSLLQEPSPGARASDDEGASQSPSSGLKTEADEMAGPSLREDIGGENKSALSATSSEGMDPSPENTTKGPAILTVNTLSPAGKEEISLAGVEVLYADAKEKSYKKGCISNERGRCVIRFPSALEAPISVMAAKKGFKTMTAQVSVRGPSKHKVILERGLTLDIHALSRAYNHVEGLPHVDVFIENKKVGTTDRLGHFSYVFTGKREALVGVTLKGQGYLPEVYETDFVASGPMSIVKYFASPLPPSVVVALLPPMPAGSVDHSGIAQISGPIQEAIKSSARKHFFSTSAFKEMPQTVFERAVKQAKLDLMKLKREGWVNTSLKSQVDTLMVPTIITGAKPAIEISMIDNKGQVIAAAREELDSAFDLPGIDRAIYLLTGKIIKGFPFEGAVVGKDGDSATINIGQAQGRGVKSGDLVDVYGVQVERFGDKEKHKKIGTLHLKDVMDGQSKGSLSWMAPRAMIERGDLVVLRPRRASDVSATQIHVQSREGGRIADVAQANVYLNGQWLGTTDESGRLYSDGAGSGTLRVVKHGFREQALEAKLTPKGRLDVVLARESAFIKIESRPSGATVSVEGKSLGRTPLVSPIPVPSGFIRIKLEGGSGYKPYSAVLELDEGTLDLTGGRAITLETDFIAQANRLKKSGKNVEAAQILGTVPPTHTDYLLARFEAGEMWLSILDNPAKAESFFAEVLADESVKSFSDKRFIGAHINAGIAQFKVAESLMSQDPVVARPVYQKVIDGLDAVLPHIRHVPSDQYNNAVHTVDYYRALARHRLWTTSQDPQMLADTVKTWRAYLEGDAKSLPPEGSSKALLQNAEVYFKQAVASLEVAKNTVKQ